MEWKERYKAWEQFSSLDEEVRSQLTALQKEENKLKEAFYKNLEFGTGGMRGEIGPGTNRLNIYTIRKASDGLARYIEGQGEEAKKRGVVIAYDSRHKSPEFAMEAAKTLATHGIIAYVFDELRPTPELSFAVRYLQAFSGIVVTASHNPPEYNGFKVYGKDGGQLPPEAADIVVAKMNEVENELLLKVDSEQQLREKGLIQIIGPEIDQNYTKKLLTISENPNLAKESDIQIVFTPLHGTSNKLVQRALRELGFQHVEVVAEQEMPDPNFSTVKSPNPEEHAAFEYAIKLGNQRNADLLIATDPDADRLGIAVKNYVGEYVVLTGNQTGALLIEYILSQKKVKDTLPVNGVILKTIVTSELGRSIASAFGMNTIDVLTGFKFIGEKIKEYEQTGEYQFLFGYEESYGYLISDFARDKDALQAAILAAEVCAYYKKQGLSLYDGLLNIYKKYGFYREGLKSITLKGIEGAEKIQQILASFRKEQLREVNGIKVGVQEDYLTGERITAEGKIEEIELPKSNVIKYILEDGSWLCLRPSGTEPKIKFYFGVKGDSLESSQIKLEEMMKDFMNKIEKLVEIPVGKA